MSSAGPLVGVGLTAIGYAVWRSSRRSGTRAHTFVETVRTASAQREAELREAVGVLEELDRATPRHDAVVAGRHKRPGRHERTGRDAAYDDLALDDDAARSLTPEEARALLLDPAGPSPERALEGR